MDDIEALHDSISELEVQVENLENERNFHVAKVRKLSAVNSREKDELQKSLVEKSQHIADLSMENYKLREQISSSSAENERLLQERAEENRMLRELVESIQNERITSSTMSNEFTPILSSEDDVSDDSSLTPDSKKALDSAAMKIKIYIEKLRKERLCLKNKCKDQGERILLLEKSNEELQAKIESLEGPRAPVEDEPVAEEKAGFDSLPPPPISDDEKGDENTIETEDEASDGEYEDEFYGKMYYDHKDVEEELQGEPKVLRSSVRSGSMDLANPRQASQREGRRRQSDTAALKALVQRRRGSNDSSVSSLGIDEGSVATAKMSANLRTANNSRSARRTSDLSNIASHTSRAPNNSRSARRTSDFSIASHTSRAPTYESLSSRSLMTSILREHDSPGSVKKRLANSLASPWRSPRFLRRGLSRRNSNNKKSSLSPPRTSFVAQSPPTTNKRSSMSKAISSPELMTSKRRAAAQAKLQKRKPNEWTESDSPGASRSPKKKQGYAMKVDGVRGMYSGPTRDDVPHGIGTVVFANGDTYIGNVVNGKLHGSGTLYYGNKKGGIDRGIWRNNKRIWQ